MRDDKLIEAMAIAAYESEWGPWEDAEDEEKAEARERMAVALAAAEAAGYRMVREARECRHCGWLCAPNSEQSKSWYPLEQAPAVPEGWSITRNGSYIAVEHPKFGGYAALADDPNSIASAILYRLAESLTAAAPQPEETESFAGETGPARD